MNGSVVHSISVNLAKRANFYLQKEGIEFQKMVLGFEITIINIEKLFLIFLLSAFLGVVWQTALTIASFAVIRRSAFGLHSKSSAMCTLASILMFVAAPFLLKGVTLHNMLAVPLLTCAIMLLYKYAPADTDKHPLLGAKNRAALKKKTVYTGIIVTLVAAVIPNQSIKLYIVLGMLYAVVSILPLTYKILKRSCNNYEKYE